MKGTGGEPPTFLSNSEFFNAVDCGSGGAGVSLASERETTQTRVKAPKHQLSVKGGVFSQKQRVGWLRSSHSSKEFVTDHPPRLHAPKIIGTKLVAETLEPPKAAL